MSIEPLESRIAPASLVISGDQKSVTWTDSDGDAVTLTITLGTLEESNFVHTDEGAGLIVNRVNLTDPEFAGTSLTVSAKRIVATDDAVGNGLVDIGYINAAGNALTAVKIGGDLGRLDAGPAALTVAKQFAVKTVSVVSLGSRPDILDGVLPGSEINGRIASFTVAGELRGALHVTGDSFGSIDRLTVGTIVGGEFADSGRVDVSGNIKTLTIRGDVAGGQGQHSGSVEAGGSIGLVVIGGSLSGGKGELPSTDGTGVIRAGTNMGAVTIRGSIFGGTQQESGLLEAGGRMGTVNVLGGIYGGSAGSDNGGIRAGFLSGLNVKGDIRGGAAEHSGFVEIEQIGAFRAGSLIGGEGQDSGMIAVSGRANSVFLRDVIGGGTGAGKLVIAGPVTSVIMANLFGGNSSDSGVLSLGVVKNLTITGDIVGGSISNLASADIEKSGTVSATQITKLSVSGSIRAGEDFSSAFDLINTAAVRVSNDLLTIAVKGGLVGTEETRVLITARGQAVPVIDSGIDLAIRAASFGSVAYADIFAGYNTASDLESAAVNPNAQIGTVAVGGAWIASNLVAGAAYNANFGGGGNVKSAGVDNPDVTSRIASILIKGAIQGTAAGGDHYGFVAQDIGSFTFGVANKLLLNTGGSNDNDTTSLRYSLANTGDVRLFELAI